MALISSKGLQPLLIAVVLCACCIISAKKCPGFCTKDPGDCISKGGKVVGYCTNDFACCDVTASSIVTCGESRGNESANLFFQSPKFPEFGKGDLVCSFSFQLQNDTVGILLDFQDFDTDDVTYKIGASTCDMDTFFIRGFSSWSPPPVCGHLKGYKMVIDDAKLDKVKELTLLGVMSSSKHRWNIKITQIRGKDWPDEEKAESAKENRTRVENATAEMPFTRDGYGEVTNSSQENTNFGANEGSQRIRAVNLLTTDIDTGSLVTPLAVNGDDALPGQVPWQASIRLDFINILQSSHGSGVRISGDVAGCDVYEGKHFCGGAIIGDQEILTAAHCFYAQTKTTGRMRVPEVTVVLGDSNNCRDGEKANETSGGETMSSHVFGNPTAKAYEVDSIVTHYAYDPSVVMNDIAVVRLKTKIELNKHVKPISLAKTGKDFTYKKAFLSGWGLLDAKNRGSKVLKSNHNLKVESNKKCRPYTLKLMTATEGAISASEKYKGILESKLCTTPLNKSVNVLLREGDFGGPLVHFDEDSSNPVLIGVASFGLTERRMTADNTAGNFIDFYQSVAYQRNWIDTALLALRLTG